MFNQILSFLSGKKTYIISAVLVCLNALQIAGYIQIPQQQIDAVNFILAACGLGTLRLGVSKMQLSQPQASPQPAQPQA